LQPNPTQTINWRASPTPANREIQKMPHRLDDQLLDAARAGDKGALEILLERYQTKVYRFGMKMCRDPEDAEDVLQDTLLSMARNIHDFRGASSLSTWLYSIARSHCVKKRRRSKFAPDAEISLETAGAEEAASLVDEGRGPDEAVSDREIVETLEKAIGSLEPIYREVLILRDVEGLTAPEVAEVLGIKVQAVKSRLHRARLAIREDLAHLLVPEESEPASADPCPDVLPLFSQYLEGDISPEVCTTMEAHLERCARCTERCESLKRTLALCHSSATAEEVPERVQAAVHAALRRFLGEGG